MGLRGRGWSRSRSALVVTLGAALVIAFTAFVIVLAFVPYIQDVVGGITSGLDSLQAQLDQVRIPPDLVGAAQQAASDLESWMQSSVGAIIGAAGQVATVAILSFFLTFFLLMDGDKGWAWALQAGGEQRLDQVTDSGRDAIERVGGYLRGTAVLSAIRALAVLVFLWIGGVPLAAPLAVLVFLGGFIPYIGGLFTTLIVALVALGSNGLQTALVLVVLIAITNFLLGKLVGPAIYGRAVKIHPAARTPGPAHRSSPGRRHRAVRGDTSRRIRARRDRFGRRRPRHRAGCHARGVVVRAGLARSPGPVELADPGRHRSAGRRGRPGGRTPGGGPVPRARPGLRGHVRAARASAPSPRLGADRRPHSPLRPGRSRRSPSSSASPWPRSSGRPSR